MDQIKIGKFIATLRRQSGLTQEKLGEKIGVTNKTISRWENGNYMPDIEMLQLLAKEFNVSINELLAGQKEHISLFVVLLLIIIVAFVLPFVVSKPWFVGLVPLIAFIEYGYQNNRMMIYVENCLYK